jgi:hypothetical protein
MKLNIKLFNLLLLTLMLVILTSSSDLLQFIHGIRMISDQLVTRHDMSVNIMTKNNCTPTSLHRSQVQ